MDAQRCWTTPIREDRYVTLGQGGSGPQGIIEVTGHWNCFDVYIAEASAAWRDVRVQARSMTGSGIAIVGDTSLQMVQGQFTPQGEAGLFSALVFSIRGRTCERFSVLAFPTLEHLPRAHWWVHAWGEGDVYGDLATRLPVDLFASGARRETGLATLTTVLLADTLIAANPDGGQTALTHLSLSTSDPDPVQVDLSYQVGADPAVIVSSWWLSLDGGPLAIDYTYPLRSPRGGRWFVTTSVPSAADVSVIVSAQGFYE